MPKKKYNPKEIESRWQKKWEEDKIYEPDFKKSKKPFYNLMMFPYPSAEGLHVGNMYAFTGSDIYGRFKRMQGYDVFEPIGLDGFGIHSENYALKIGTHPAKQAKISEKRFYKQLQMIGNGFAWNERLETYNPEYYKWTQWIFTQMFKNGLAYRKKQQVNWCPSCKTVLADEQVISGECERCSSAVVKKDLEQWFFRITKYAGKLLKNLENIDWSEKIKIAQRNWIGESKGALIKFPVSDSKFLIEVFTTRPDTIFGATYIVLAPEHHLVKELEPRIKNFKEVEKYAENAKKKSRIEEKEKTGVELEGIKAINLATKEEIPIFIADYVSVSYGTGAIMAVPAHDERDWDFAKKYKLPFIKVIKGENVKNSVYTEDGILINSGKFSGMDSKKAKIEITKSVGGKIETQYHLRDWLISRQRYWGAPIPMIYCEHCAKAKKGESKEMPGWYSVPEKDLPVKLPFAKNFRPEGEGKSPLALIKSFYETKCPACGKKARRETDVSDTFLDSAWYYLRYLEPNNKKSAWTQPIIKKWLPVEMYIGGAEHAVLHLLYVRFAAMALYDWGLIHFDEPFKKFRAHGLLVKEGAKMSKSKGNVVNPDEYVKRFGADTLRMYLMFLAPFEQGGDFRDSAVMGIARFLNRVWKIFSDFSGNNVKSNEKIQKIIHQTTKKITGDIEGLSYNTAISALMVLLNEMEKQKEDLAKKDMEVFLKLLAPFAPHITEELWHQLGNKKSIHLESWPEYDKKIIIEDSFNLVIQINGKLKDAVEMPVGASDKEIEKTALASEKIIKFLEGKKPKKTVIVKNRLINIVV